MALWRLNVLVGLLWMRPVLPVGMHPDICQALSYPLQYGVSPGSFIARDCVAQGPVFAIFDSG
jgi:hypothetical protein